MRKAIPLILLLLVIAAGIYVVTRLLVIKEIRCTSQYGPCSKVVEDALGDLEGTRYVDFNKDISVVFGASAYIEGYSASFKPPSRMDVEVVERKTSNALKIKDEDVYVLVDPSGKITEFVDETNLPHVQVDSKEGSVGDTVSADKLNALDIISRMYYVYAVKSGDLREGSLYVSIDSGISVIFPVTGDTDVLIASLGLIVSNLQVEGKESRIDEAGVVKEIDLRYKNPVVR